MNKSLKFWLPSLLSGVLIVLSSAPYDIWYLAYVAYVPLFLAYRNEAPVRQGLAYALCCSLVASNWWHSTIIYSALFFILIVSILCFAFFIWGYLCANSRVIKSHPVAELFMPAVMWIGIERILSSELVGIPCNIGISQWGQPLLIQSASLFGIYATSFLLVLTNTTIAMTLRGFAENTLRQRTYSIAILMGFAVFAGNIIMGYSLTNKESVLDKPLTVSVIQPVIATDMYLNSWRSPDTRHYVKQIISDLTINATKSKPDILVWPEGGNGYFNLRISELRDFLYTLAKENKIDLLISSNDLDEEGKKYNSIFSISKQGRLLGRYDKVQLIPGPEDSYTAGQGYNTIPGSYGAIGPSICYESNFPSPLRRVTVNGANLLFVSTSDAAFKKTALTINHTRTAVFRAVENNRWVIHASNTGPSAIVSPTGYMVSEGKMFERGVISGQVEMIAENSFFTSYGHWLPIVFAIYITAIMLFNIYLLRNVPADFVRNIALRLSKDEDEIEVEIKALSFRVLTRYLPASLFMGCFIVAIISTSIVIVFKQVSADEPVINAYHEFTAPLDTFVKDEINDKFLQAKSNTCGPAVLAYISTFFGKEIEEDDVISKVEMTQQGTSMLELKKAAIAYGFNAQGVKASYGALLKEPLPAIAYINDSHYVVLNEVTASSVYVFDPAIGHVKLSRQTFERAWKGYLLLVRMRPIKSSMDDVEMNVLENYSGPGLEAL